MKVEIDKPEINKPAFKVGNAVICLKTDEYQLAILDKDEKWIYGAGEGLNVKEGSEGIVLSTGYDADVEPVDIDVIIGQISGTNKEDAIVIMRKRNDYNNWQRVESEENSKSKFYQSIPYNIGATYIALEDRKYGEYDISKDEIVEITNTNDKTNEIEITTRDSAVVIDIDTDEMKDNFRQSSGVSKEGVEKYFGDKKSENQPFEVGDEIECTKTRHYTVIPKGETDWLTIPQEIVKGTRGYVYDISDKVVYAATSATDELQLKIKITQSKWSEWEKAEPEESVPDTPKSELPTATREETELEKFVGILVVTQNDIAIALEENGYSSDIADNLASDWMVGKLIECIDHNGNIKGNPCGSGEEKKLYQNPEKELGKVFEEEEPVHDDTGLYGVQIIGLKEFGIEESELEQRGGGAIPGVGSSTAKYTIYELKGKDTFIVVEDTDRNKPEAIAGGIETFEKAKQEGQFFLSLVKSNEYNIEKAKKVMELEHDSSNE